MKYPFVYVVLTGLALTVPTWGAPDRGDEPAGAVAASKVAAAIADLGSSDPKTRERAARTLIELGAEARRAVALAAQSEDPELRTRASELLLRLPWYLPDDSPGVRGVLEHYGQLDVERRKNAVASLANLSLHGYEALLRLIVEEPSDDVRWAIVAAVRRDFRETDLEGFRRLDAESENAPVLAAAGHAWLSKNVDRGVRLLKRAVALDLERPAADGGEVEAVFDRLQNLALMDGSYEEVAKLLRLRARRGAVDEDGEPTQAVLELFAAHAKFGPLPGFEQDLQTYKDQLGDPRVMFSLGKIYERSGQTLLAEAAYRAAFLTDLVSIDDRFEQGEFTMRQGWLDLAEAEFASVFELAPDHSTENRKVLRLPGIPADALVHLPILDQANAHFRLAQVGAARQDDAAAADHMERAMKLHYRAHGELRGATDQSLWAEIDWHRLRAARAKGDGAEVNRRIESILTAQTSTADNDDEPRSFNPDIANDAVPLLREMERTEEAQKLFDQTYEKLVRLQEKSRFSDHDHPMSRNNLAWLCARCDEHKEEALKLALEATRAMPDNAAFVDTLAEVQFRLGNYAEAARLERRVVAARPNDRFLREQLRRFEEAAAAPKKNGGN